MLQGEKGQEQGPGCNIVYSNHPLFPRACMGSCKAVCKLQQPSGCSKQHSLSKLLAVPEYQRQKSGLKGAGDPS